MARLLSGQALYNMSQQFNLKYNVSVCILCDKYEKNDIEHLLFECTRFDTKRRILWTEVLNVLPKSMACFVNRCSSREKVIFFFSCLNHSLVLEWMDVYRHFSQFVYQMYSDREKLMRNLKS